MQKNLVALAMASILITAGCATAASTTNTTASSTASTSTVAPSTSTPAATDTKVPPTRNARRGPVPEPTVLDVKIDQFATTGGGFIRMVYDKAANSLIYLGNTGELYELALAKTDQTEDEGKRIGTSRDVLGPPVYPVCQATGLAIGPDRALYVTCNAKNGPKSTARVRKGVLGANGKRSWVTLMQTEPFPIGQTQFDHDFNGLAVSPDNQWLYINSGSRTDHGELQENNGANKGVRETDLTSAVFRVPVSATATITLPNDAAKLKAAGYLFADGTRNCYDLAFAGNGDLFCGDNGPDADYPDEINWLREGHHYGFPWKFGAEDNPQTDPNYDASKDNHLREDFFAVANNLYKADPSFPKPPAGVTFTLPVLNMGPDADKYRMDDGSEADASDAKEPLAGITPHRSPLGLSFDVDNMLSGSLKGSGFFVSWGAAGGTLSDKGQDLIHMQLKKEGTGDDAHYVAQMWQLAKGFSQPIDTVLVGNVLYVLDNGGQGNIWAVTLP